jgi:hypothetical protein
MWMKKFSTLWEIGHDLQHFMGKPFSSLSVRSHSTLSAAVRVWHLQENVERSLYIEKELFCYCDKDGRKVFVRMLDSR